MSNDLIEVARFSLAADAALAKNRLEQEEIPAVLSGEAMGSWFWYLGSATGGVKLLVASQDEKQAREILGSPVDQASLEDVDFGDRSAEEDADDTEDVSPEVTRAFRASIIGIALLPPVLNLYSTYLLFHHGLFRSPRNWRVAATCAVNLFVFSLVLLIIGVVFFPPRNQQIPDFPAGEPLRVEEKRSINLIP